MTEGATTRTTAETESNANVCTSNDNITNKNENKKHENNSEVQPEKQQNNSHGRTTTTTTTTTTTAPMAVTMSVSNVSRIECPCHNFTALSKIVDVLSSEDSARAESMIEWLNGSTDRIAVRQRKLLSCGKRFQCRYRYGTSFAILRAIRDACAPFQTAAAVGAATATATATINTDGSNSSSNKDRLEKVAQQQQQKPSYDQSFPPLQHHPGFSNILTPPVRKKDQKANKKASNRDFLTGKNGEKVPAMTTVVNTLQARKKKPKARIQPQQQLSTTTSSSTWAGNSSGSTWGSAPSSFLAGPPIVSKQTRGISINTGEQATRTRQPAITTISTINGTVNALQARKKKPKRPVESPRRPTPVELVLDSESIGTTGFRTPPRTTINTLNTQQYDKNRVATKKDPVVVTPTKSSKKSSKNREVGDVQMERFVDIYIALIKNMLVPSTPLEVHLLIELLSIDTEENSSTEQSQQDQSNQSLNDRGSNEATGSVTGSATGSSAGSTLFFQPIFHGPERCVRFAQRALTKLQTTILQRMSPFLVKSLLRDGVFLQRCPAVAERLNRLLVECTTAAEWKPPSSESVTGTHAIFSLPFQPDRDSRHNFKTAAELSMYQNREVTRDAFLSELRVFITAKSKVFLPQQVDKVRDTAQYESRKIIANVSSHNVLWFAQFFCELLLQVGLAPVDEMDQELLKIAADDRVKLQKLHKRFTKKTPSRGSQTRAGFASTTATTARSNERNSNNHKSSTTTTTSMFHDALSYFPGYQEFFFIFLYSVNSFNFGMHLVHQVVKKMSDMMSNHSSSGLEKRTLELALLGRFLGFLVFSPNWQEEGIDLNKMKPFICSLDHGLDLLESIGLPLPKIVKEAWDGGYTSLTIPWVIELLKMSKWDSISQSSMNYRQILANLRLIQGYTSQPNKDEDILGGSHLQILSFHLETFFNDTFSLPKLTSLPDATIALSPEPKPESLDNQKIGLSTAAIYASSPHMEDLCDMITHMTKKTTRHEVKRKLRPSIVSTAVGAEARSYLGAESPRGKVMSPPIKASWKGLPMDKSAEGKKLHTQNKLVEGFFHQHRDLKEICDFTVNQSLNSLSVDEIHGFVMQAANELSIGAESTETEIEDMQMRAFQLSRGFLRDKLTKTLAKSIDLFSHSDTERGVIVVATKLSTDSGMELSQPIVRGLIASSTKTALKDLENKGSAPKCNNEEIKTEIDHAIRAATSSIINLQNEFFKVVDSKSKMRLIEEALEWVETVTKSVLIPRENLLRDFFESILDLEPMADIMINQVLESNTPELWAMICAFFRLLERIALISGYWRSRISSLFGEDFVRLLKDRTLHSPSETKMMFDQLTRCSKSRTKPSTNGNIGVKADRADSIGSGIIEPVAIQFSE